MKIIISPAKNINFDFTIKDTNSSNLKFQKEAEKLIEVLRKFQPHELIPLMKISGKLAELNFLRFQDWHLPFTEKNSKQAIFAFNGDVYRGLEAQNMSKEDLAFAQKNLYILSGLYGILKPLDLIQAYRLEMGIKLKTNYGKNMYEFWGNKITDFLNEEFKEQKNPVLINLASKEYFKAINTHELKARIITPQFKEERDGKLKIISFYAKKARGLMSRFIIQNRIENPNNIKAFDIDNYQFNENFSDDNNWIFTR